MKSRVVVIVLAVAIPLLIVAAALAFRGDDDSRERLPVALSPSTTVESAAAAADMALFPYGGIRYEAGPDLPQLGGEAPAYRLDGTATPDQFSKLASVVGVDAEPEDDGYSLNAEDGDGRLSLEKSGALGWSYAPTNGGGATSGGVVTACSSEANDCEAPVTTVPTRPADLPSEDAARARALDLLHAAGNDVEHVNVTVDDGTTEWVVRVTPIVDGVPVEDLPSAVAIGAGGAIDYANGFLAKPVKVGTYPLVTTDVAIDRLNQGIGVPGPVPLLATDTGSAVADGANGTGAGSDAVAGSAGDPETTTVPAPPVPGTAGTETTILESDSPPDSVEPAEPDEPLTSEPSIEPDPYPTVTIEPPEPQVVVLTGADVVLVRTYGNDGRSVWLLPAYRFTQADGDRAPTVLAVADEYLSGPSTPTVTGKAGPTEPQFKPPGPTVVPGSGAEPAPASDTGAGSPVN